MREEVRQQWLQSQLDAKSLADYIINKRLNQLPLKTQKRMKRFQPTLSEEYQPETNGRLLSQLQNVMIWLMILTLSNLLLALLVLVTRLG